MRELGYRLRDAPAIGESQTIVHGEYSSLLGNASRNWLKKLHCLGQARQGRVACQQVLIIAFDLGACLTISLCECGVEFGPAFVQPILPHSADARPKRQPGESSWASAAR
jgi:hypothetical protein